MIKVDSDRADRASDVSVTNGMFGSHWLCSSGSGKEWKVEKNNDEYVCNCPDFKKGNVCKHVIAVLKLNKEEFEIVSKENNKDYSKYSKLGYDRWEVVSAFHKELRRGDFKEASYWLQIIIICEPSAAFYVNNYVNGIIGEELCTCDPQVVVNLKSFLNFKAVDEYMLYAVVEYFCEAKKWWECKKCSDRRRTWFNNVVATKNLGKDKRREIPYYALDPHTRRGKQLHKDGKADMRWSGRAEGMFWRRHCVEQGKDLLSTKWEEVEYQDLDKMVWIEDIWDKD